VSDETARFTHAYCAAAYLLGARGRDVAGGLQLAGASLELVRRLELPDREQRAKALAPELARLIAAYDALALENATWR
jgi:hypothetical protein